MLGQDGRLLLLRHGLECQDCGLRLLTLRGSVPDVLAFQLASDGLIIAASSKEPLRVDRVVRDVGLRFPPLRRHSRLLWLPDVMLDKGDNCLVSLITA